MSVFDWFPNKEQLLGIIRYFAIAASTYVVAKGWMDANLAGQLVTFAVGILATIWGVSANSQAATIAKAEAIKNP